jgi:oxygen-dependent protoporphyrinogen oxidase
MSDFDAIVLGGGISGLTAGFWLREKGRRVLVLEASDRPGGCITTWGRDGFLFELGPNTVLNNALEIDALCEAAGLMGSRLTANPASKKRFIVKGGRLVPLPGNPPAFLFSSLFSPKTKLGLLKEPFVGRPPEGVEEDIARFVRRRLGEEMLRYAVGPFVSGVYAGDPERLSVRHAVPKIYALEEKYGSLIKGAIAKKKGPAPAGGLFSFPEGLKALPETLAERLGDGYRSGVTVRCVEQRPEGFAVRASDDGGGLEVTARAVLCALPAQAASSALAPLGGDFPAGIASLPYADVALLCLGFRRQDIVHPLDGFGCLAPEVEGRYFLGCLFTSSLFPGRAPEGHVALSVFVGGALHPERADAPEETVTLRVLSDLDALLGLKGGPVLTRLERWQPAIPQYNLGHGSYKEAARALEEANPGLFVSGNLLYGVSVGNCIQNATGVAALAEEYLRS